MNAVAHAPPLATHRAAERTLEVRDRITGRRTELPVRKGTLGPGVIDARSIYSEAVSLADRRRAAGLLRHRERK